VEHAREREREREVRERLLFFSFHPYRAFIITSLAHYNEM
jgi:hypothetical protein